MTQFEACCYAPQDDGSVECNLCIINCRIPQGKRGLCRVRENRDGKLYALTYGLLSSFSTDFVEKVPLYHFYPNHKFLTVGSAGCNLGCKFCLTWSITQVEPEDVDLEEMAVDAMVRSAKELDTMGVVYTHSEPTLNIEYYTEMAKAARDAGLKNVFATNGFVTQDAFEMISPYLDAVALTVKGTEEFYKKTCGVHYNRDHLTSLCKGINEKSIHLEVVHILVPGPGMEANADEAILIAREAGAPLIFLRFFPSHKMDKIRSTPEDDMEAMLGRAYAAGVRYAYVENIHYHPGKTTYCESCKTPLIRREGYGIVDWRLEGRLCSVCGTRIPIVGEPLYKRKSS